jgi:nitric oxide reductase subunit B
MLFSVRNIVRKAAWSDGLLKVAFWGLNLGLAGMIVLSLAPAGFYQFLEAIRHGIWYARSPEVTGSSFIHTVTWLRIGPDIVFDVGAGALVAFLVRAIVVDLRLRRSETAATREAAKETRRRAA